MLLSFSVSNYLSIDEEQTLSLVATKLDGPHEPISGGPQTENVLPCAIIYGPNASGKSNLVAALLMLRAQVLSSHSRVSTSQGIPHRPFRLNDENLKKPTTMEASFIINGVRFDYGLTFNDEIYLEEWLYTYPEGRRRRLFERVGQKVTFGSEFRGSKKVLVEFMRPNSLFLSTATQNDHEELSSIRNFFEDFYASNQISVASQLINATFKEGQIDTRSISFLEKIGTGVVGYKQTEVDVPETWKAMAKDFLTIAKKHMGDDADELNYEEDDKDYSIELAHRAKNQKNVYFGTENESSGTRRLLLILNGIFKILDEGTVAIIDELDASLHTHAVEALIQLFVDPEINKKGAQLIATTHDTNLLNPNLLRRDEIWFVEKSHDGASRYYSLSEVKTRKGDDFEASYLRGRYGAIPHVSWLKRWRLK
ncbi:AAA family ATPase [Brucella anthropi]|uniref:AAA family ATPase n=1 Tax=Brucella anthropi TaxID=529 RepID=UPI0003A09065|nr:ATP-binding protein [Brucella anthropi]